MFLQERSYFDGHLSAWKIHVVEEAYIKSTVMVLNTSGFRYVRSMHMFAYFMMECVCACERD